jgi:hypothetical protein
METNNSNDLAGGCHYGLNKHDLQFALRRLPRLLKERMKQSHWAGGIFVGGGYLRAVVANEEVSDIDVFVSSKADADKLARELAIANIERFRPGAIVTEASLKREIYETANAITLTKFKPAIQIIHRWVFQAGPDVAQSFDFTVCAAVFWFDGENWCSYVDPTFYEDLAAKRLVYRSPKREEEEPGGSMLRVLKYYQKGYRIPLDSLAKVIDRLMDGVNRDRATNAGVPIANVILGRLREVDPLVDPEHIAHLPSIKDENDDNKREQTIGDGTDA